MLARAAPANGDIVVREEEREGMLAYVLHTAPGPGQYLLRTREEAVVHALTFAKGASVRAWLVSGESDIVLLGEFEAPKSEEDGLPTEARPGLRDDASRTTAMGTMLEVLARLRAEYLEIYVEVPTCSGQASE